MKIKLNKREFQVVQSVLVAASNEVWSNTYAAPLVAHQDGPNYELRTPTREEVRAIGEKRFGLKPPKPAKGPPDVRKLVGKLADKLADKSARKIVKKLAPLSDAERVKFHDHACSMMDDLNRTLGAYAGSKFSPDAEKRMRGLKEIVIHLKVMIAQKGVAQKKDEAKPAPKARAKAGPSKAKMNGRAVHT